MLITSRLNNIILKNKQTVVYNNEDFRLRARELSIMEKQFRLSIFNITERNSWNVAL